ncbi:MAG TPA: rhodanese-like domain-containing protein [Myxococcaceae bacterium]|nr:rhodanese-like domain-containing protein [Myxococcaceae bacterium]
MPRWILFAVLAVGAVVFLTFRARAQATRSQQAHQAVEQGALLLDVRTPEEFASGHLQGAVNIPVDELERRAKELPSRQAGIVIYCRSGNRSRRAEHILRDKGFEKLIDLGPMSAW